MNYANDLLWYSKVFSIISDLLINSWMFRPNIWLRVQGATCCHCFISNIAGISEFQSADVLIVLLLHTACLNRWEMISRPIIQSNRWPNLRRVKSVWAHSHSGARLMWIIVSFYLQTRWRASVTFVFGSAFRPAAAVTLNTSAVKHRGLCIKTWHNKSLMV